MGVLTSQKSVNANQASVLFRGLPRIGVGWLAASAKCFEIRPRPLVSMLSLAQKLKIHTFWAFTKKFVGFFLDVRSRLKKLIEKIKC